MGVTPGENPFVTVYQFMDLGVVISKNFKWKDYILKAIRKSIKVFQVIRRVIPFSLSIEKKLLLSKTLILG